MNLVYIGMGSNLGDPVQNLKTALSHLQDVHGLDLLRISSFYRSAPVGYEDQDWFVNSVAEGETSRSPRDLLLVLQSIEKAMGRDKRFRWGPRNIDLDILFFAETVLEEQDLILPHPRADQRRFVLEPLVELAPDRIHPKSGKTFRTLLSELGNSQPVWKMEGVTAAPVSIREKREDHSAVSKQEM